MCFYVRIKQFIFGRLAGRSKLSQTRSTAKPDGLANNRARERFYEEFTDYPKIKKSTVMIKNEEIVEDLNDLVRINNDRIQGYEKAIEGNDDAQLSDLFRHYVVQSQKFRSQLAEHIVRIDGTAVTDAASTDITSKVHRAWIDIKTAVTGKDRDTVLSSVEFGENIAVEAYKNTIEKDHIPAYIKEDLTMQLSELNEAYQKMKAMHKAA